MDNVAQLEATGDRTLNFLTLTMSSSTGLTGRANGPCDSSCITSLTQRWCYSTEFAASLANRSKYSGRFDQDVWASGRSYAQLPLDLSRRIYESVRNGIIYQVHLHYEKDGHREFVHSQTGVRSLKDEFDRVVSHNEKHLGHSVLALKS